MTTGPILVIGGGSNQLPLVLEAKRRGLTVIVTDMYADPPCSGVADEFHRIDTTDRMENLELARSRKIGAVVTDQSDVAVPTAAYIAEDLGLPGIGFETALRFTNKHVMRTALRERDSDLLPESTFFRESDALFAFLASGRVDPRTRIVKPINSQGSKGVARLKESGNNELVVTAFREARGQGVLLESFIGGEEYSVEAFTVEKKVVNLAVTRKFHYASNDCIDFRNTYLGDVSPKIERLLFEANERVIGTLGLVTGSTHAEFKVSEGKVYLMEIAARGGGGNISGKIIPFLTGFDPTSALLDFALGKVPEVSASSYRDRFVAMRFFDFMPGQVRRVIARPPSDPGLLHFELNLRPGDTVRPIRSSRDRVGYFVVGASTRDSVLSLEERVLRSVTLEYGP